MWLSQHSIQHSNYANNQTIYYPIMQQLTTIASLHDSMTTSRGARFRVLQGPLFLCLLRRLAQLALMLAQRTDATAHDVSYHQYQRTILGTEVDDTNCEHVPTDTESRTKHMEDTANHLSETKLQEEVPMELTPPNHSNAFPPDACRPYQSACADCTPAARPISSPCMKPQAEIFQSDPCRSKADCGE
jgi:hypothetical protein